MTESANVKIQIRDTRAPRRYYIDNVFLRGGWGQVLGPYGIAVYNALALHADGKTQDAWPSLDTIAELTGMTRQTAAKAVADLEEYRIIAVDRTARNHVYILLDRAGWKPVNPVNKSRNTSPRTGAANVNPVNTNKTHDLTTTTNELRSLVDSSVPEPSGFTVKEIKQLELTDEQWRELAEQEKDGKNRKGVLDFVERRLNRPPPAVEIYRGIMQYYPKTPLWEGVDRVVGRKEADLQFWEKVIKHYIACGWNGHNVKNMLAFFEKRVLPGDTGYSRPEPRQQPQPARPTQPQTQYTPEQIEEGKRMLREAAKRRRARLEASKGRGS